MSESDENNLNKELVKAGVEIVKETYDDALKPVAQETGKALQTIGRTVNVALSPIRGLVWSWEQIEGYVSETVQNKLLSRNVPDERITTPDADIAVPALEAMRYSKLKENFANLLATSMDSATVNEAHPSYVEILKQLTPDEAKILEFLPDHGRYEPVADLSHTVSKEKGQFLLAPNVSTIGVDSGCELPEQVPKYLDNLCRLGLTEVPAMRRLAEGDRYDRIRKMPIVGAVEKQIPAESKFDFVEKMIGLTVLGESFRSACIID